MGQVSTELQILDSSNGNVLAEAYNRRVGAHTLRPIGSTGGDVEDAVGEFAERLATGLERTHP